MVHAIMSILQPLSRQHPMPHLTALQSFSLPQVRIDCLAAAAMLVFLCGWQWRVTGHLSIGDGISLLFLLALYVAFGNLFTRLIAPHACGMAGLPFQLLAGYFVFNSLLFMVALCSPMGMALNLVLLSVVAVAGLRLWGRRGGTLHDATAAEHLAGCLAIVISCIGATIWCGDAQTPPQTHNGITIFTVWHDVYIHAREISVFAQAHGIGSIEDIKLAGGRAPIYHFASYLSPAAISVLSGASAMQVYSSLQLPLGIVLTGLAAYCLMAKLFGWGPGLAATVAIVLFPDAFQQGFQNRYLSYNFLAQINLGMLYGIACAALAWMFMLDGCRRKKIVPVLLAYGFLAICLFYKAHLFVANSYVLMIFPFLFFSAPVRPAWRAGAGVAATLLFCLIVAWSQSNPRVPVLRLDGSGIGRYIITLLGYYDTGWMKQELTRIFLHEKHSFLVEAALAAGMLMVSTFGVWIIGLGAMLLAGRRAMPAVFWVFPVIVVANFLIMTMGLAEDTRGVGSPDELINRPLVWAYFVVASWTAATGYRLLIGTGLPNGKAAAGCLAVAGVCCLAAVYCAPNLQTLPQLPGHGSFVESGSMPSCMLQAADYVRRKSAQSDIIQDAKSDPLFVFTALSERQQYVGDAVFGGKQALHRQRLDDIATVPAIADAGQLQAFFRRHHIDWYLQHPDTPLSWPASIASHPAFACGGYRLFQFSHGATTRSAHLIPATESPNKGFMNG